MTQILKPTATDRSHAKHILQDFQSATTINLSLEPDTGLYHALKYLLSEFAAGHSVVLGDPPTELTTQQAATWLGMSRPHLIKLLERGEMVFYRVGNQRRIDLQEVKAFQRKRREAVLDELAAESQRLGLYD
jgi:excisionase family DNA binding protein